MNWPVWLMSGHFPHFGSCFVSYFTTGSADVQRAGQYPQIQLAVPSFSYFWTTKLNISFHRLVAFLRLPVFEGAIMAYMRAALGFEFWLLPCA